MIDWLDGQTDAMTGRWAQGWNDGMMEGSTRTKGGGTRTQRCVAAWLPHLTLGHIPQVMPPSTAEPAGGLPTGHGSAGGSGVAVAERGLRTSVSTTSELTAPRSGRSSMSTTDAVGGGARPGSTPRPAPARGGTGGRSDNLDELPATMEALAMTEASVKK
eukprot:67061-Chlamydomonas_euryale.AAC.1